MLPPAEIEALGWKKINSASPWETYKRNNFLLSVFTDGRVEIKYYIYFNHGSGILFFGNIEDMESLKEVMQKLKIE